MLKAMTFFFCFGMCAYGLSVWIMTTRIPRLAHAQQEGQRKFLTLENLQAQIEVLAAENLEQKIRLDNLKLHRQRHYKALVDYTYHTATGSVKACREEIAKFDALMADIPKGELKSAVWRLREALDQHNKRSGDIAEEMDEWISGAKDDEL